MFNSGYQFKIIYSPEHIGYLLYVYRELSGDLVQFVRHDGTVETFKKNEGARKSDNYLFRFEDLSQLKELIAEAERVGAPSPSSDNMIGELKATKEHLSDMRALVFNKHVEIKKAKNG